MEPALNMVIRRMSVRTGAAVSLAATLIRTDEEVVFW